MANIGKNFLFYMSYWDEMEVVYWYSDYTVLTEFQYLEWLTADIKTIGDWACQESKEFLASIQNEMVTRYLVKLHARGFGYHCIKVGGEDKDFNIRIYVWKGGRSPGKLQMGVAVTNLKGMSVVRPWVWNSGGRDGAEETKRILGLGERGDDNSIYIGDVLIPGFELDNDVAAGPLVHEVVRKFEPVFENLDALWNLVR